MPEKVAATVDGVSAAIANVVRIAPDDLQKRVGTVVVTTSDRLKSDPGFDGIVEQAMFARIEEPRTTILLADRIPAGQEAWVFVCSTVLPALRQGAPDDWELLLNHLRGWGRRVDDHMDARRVIRDTAAARVVYANFDAGTHADEAMMAFAVEAAVQRGVLPDAQAKHGTAQAWLAELVSDMRKTAEHLFGNDLPSLERDSISSFIPKWSYQPEAESAKPEGVKAPAPKSRQELYQEAKAKAGELWERSEMASRALNAFIDSHGRGPMGLTPDSVKQKSEYKQLKSDSDVAMRELQQFNAKFVKQFAKERSADREMRYAARSADAISGGVKWVAKLTREEILEQRVAALARQLHEARESLRTMASLSNGGKGWHASCYKGDDVTDVVEDVLGGPCTMDEALWEIKALAERSAQPDGSGKCSPWDVSELAEQGLASGAGSLYAEEALADLHLRARRTIDETPGEWIGCAVVARAANHGIFGPDANALQVSGDRRIADDGAAPGM